jgi:hypothetical protein
MWEKKGPCGPFYLLLFGVVFFSHVFFGMMHFVLMLFMVFFTVHLFFFVMLGVVFFFVFLGHCVPIGLGVNLFQIPI